MQILNRLLLHVEQRSGRQFLAAWIAIVVLVYLIASFSISRDIRHFYEHTDSFNPIGKLIYDHATAIVLVMVGGLAGLTAIKLWRTHGT